MKEEIIEEEKGGFVTPAEEMADGGVMGMGSPIPPFGGEYEEIESPEEVAERVRQKMLDELTAKFDKAMELTISLHQNQFDKAGAPYSEHPIRVADLLYRNEYIAASYDKMERLRMIIVALLHDVIEDTDMTYEKIEEDFGKEIADGVVSVTRNADETYDEYVKRAAENNYGKWVKFFDLTDNLNIIRLVNKEDYRFTEKDLQRINKYADSYRYLKRVLGL